MSDTLFDSFSEIEYLDSFDADTSFMLYSVFNADHRKRPLGTALSRQIKIDTNGRLYQVKIKRFL